MMLLQTDTFLGVAECEVDGLDFTNDCNAGECETCACSMEYNPVCCPGEGNEPGTTYPNPCSADCEKSEAEMLKCYYGECPVCACAMLFQPTCCEGVEYGNQCEADCVGATNCEDRPCKSPHAADEVVEAIEDGDMSTPASTQCALQCPRELDPVSCDERVHPSLCAAECKQDTNCISITAEQYADALKAELEEQIEEIEGKLTDEFVGNTDDKTEEIIVEEAENLLDADVSSAQFETKMRSDCVCTMEYKPICCSGETYDNECMAECDGFVGATSECTMGECVDDAICKCTKEINLVCCPGAGNVADEQFANPCTAACDKSDAELIECHYGACPSMCACPLLHAPVCCSGVEYGNECMATCSGIDADTCDVGECPKPCTLEYVKGTSV